jgi:hypothetical protein
MMWNEGRNGLAQMGKYISDHFKAAFIHCQVSDTNQLFTNFLSNYSRFIQPIQIMPASAHNVPLLPE